MKILETEISEVMLIDTDLYKDHRGFFTETYNQEKYFLNGFKHQFLQDNLILSGRNVLRGLHFQINTPQGKLVQCIQGSIFDVAVAGLAREDLNIELAEGVLTIEHKGPKTEVVNDANEVVYQGIAQRAFKQQFTLAENVEVHGAELVNGMLVLELEKIVPDEQKPRLIDIKTPKILGSK